MAEELKELEELKNFEEAPPLWGWYLNIFPTQHIQALGWVFSHRKGARRSDIRVSLAMELLESGGSIGVEIVFLGTTGAPQEIIYRASTVTSVTVTRRPRDAWQLVEILYEKLPLKSQR